VPNAITPNSDGKNDELVIDGLEKFPENELVIFNRWGDILYASKPYRNDWQGTNKSGNPLPEGTYYYVLRLNTADGKILRGDMTILR
jgi:large repetitive protein